MSAATDVDPWLVLRALDVPCAAAPTPVTGGWDTALWRFPTADGRWHALRLLRPGQDAVARRESLAMTAAAAGGVPSAAVEAVGTWHDRPAFVLQWAAGAPLFAAIQHRPWTVWRWAAAFARMQAQLHSIPAPAELRDGAPEYWLRADAVDQPALIDRVRAAYPATDTLVHLDYHPLNVLATERCITAVIDWTNGAAGDRRADIARTAALLTLAPIPPGRARPLLDVARRLFTRAWWDAYRRRAGPVRDLAPFMAWAGAKFLRDTERRLGQPGVWAADADLTRMRRWVVRWTGRAAME